MVEKNNEENVPKERVDKKEELPTQAEVIKAEAIKISPLVARLRRQKSSCPFLGLLPKMGETALLAGFEADLQRKLEVLLENRDEELVSDIESRNSEISMLKQSLDWLKLKGV